MASKHRINQTGVQMIRAAFIVVLATMPVTINAQSQPTREYVVSHWNIEEGLPQSSVNSMVQSKDGYLWLATYGGLVRFDGVQFTVFDRSNSPALKSDRCIYIQEDKKGRLWIGTEGGVALYEKGKFSFFDKAQGLTSNIITSGFEDPSGDFWVVTSDQQFIRFDGIRFDGEHRFHLGSSNGVRQMDSVALVGTRDGFFQFDGRSLTPIFRFPSPVPSSIRQVHRSSDGSIWMTTNGTGLYRWEKGKLRIFGNKDGLKNLALSDLEESRDGSVWVGSTNGAYRFHDESIRYFSTADGLSDHDVKNILEDKEANIWFGTSTGGLNRLRRSLFTVYAREQGLREEKILSIALRRDGSLIFGSNCGGLHEFRNGRAFDSPLTRFLQNECVWTVFEDHSGTVWVGSDGIRAIRNDRVIEEYSIPSPFATFEDRENRIWVGTANGLYIREHGTLKLHRLSEKLPQPDIRTIFQDATGAMWIGTVGGLARITEDSIETWTSIPGLSSHYIRAIHEDTEGTLWFGSYGGGLMRRKNGIFRVLTTAQGLFDNIVSHVVEDGEGYFWMGSNRGISRVRKDELNSAADGKIPFVRPLVFGRSDGLLSTETNGGFQPNAVTLADGRLVFPTVQGLAIVDPRLVRRNTIPPPVVIERVIANGDPLTNEMLGSIAYDDANLEIQYTALSMTEPRKVRFRYMLEGYDADWVNAEGRRTAFYTKVPPGTHTFRVMAANNHGVWNEAGASINFTVTPPFWLSMWFQILAVAVFLSVGPAIYYYRVTSLKREKEEQEEFSRILLDSQEGERRRIAAELHDGLGQDLLIVKNRAALALQDQENTQGLIEQLRLISDGAGTMLGDVRSIAHNLRPVHLERFGLTDTLEATIDQIASSSTISWRREIAPVDNMLSDQGEIGVFRIVQEAINNILKHSGATEASVIIRIEESTLAMIIQDNGCGFKVETIVRKGMGLTGMEERAKLLGGSLHVKTSPGIGTQVSVRIPVRANGEANRE